MDIAALIVWILTALGGTVLLATWVRAGGIAQQQAGTTRLPAPVVFGHFLLAAAGLVLWIIYVVSDTKVWAWVAFVLLVLVAILGFAMFARWLPVRQAAAGAPGDVPAERHLPVPVVGVHGVAAVATVALVLLTALGVGGS